ncbi:MAG: hypothetical protein KBS74_04685 [Clostridiales bacterium]|nr:hypothetical protein [Candidatus Cacconaster stercorequi]
MVKNLGKTGRYQIFIGMNDKETLQQRCSKEDFIRIVSTVCADYRIAFSMCEQMGGYMMSDGTFITENSLVLSISGFTREQIFLLAEELRSQLNQEAIMISFESPELFLLTEQDAELNKTPRP